MKDLILTIDDESKLPYEEESSDDDQIVKNSNNKRTGVEMRRDFLFTSDDSAIREVAKRVRSRNGMTSVWNFDQVKSMMKADSKPRVSIDEMIKKRMDEKIEQDEEEIRFLTDDEYEDKIPVEDEESKEDEENDLDKEEEMSVSDREDDVDSDHNVGDEADLIREKRKADYFEDLTVTTKENDENLKKTTFSDMKLSRPLIKALADLRFTQPTKIQTLAIPVALAGKDICGAASTGSGKTAAFLLPILERLIYRPKGHAVTRVLVLTPTRELAAQCHSVGVQLARYTDITFALCVGGLSNKDQEAELKKRPDVVIATPGRLIDHLQNSACFGLETLEILIMDEADRMLEEGFEAELTEIIRQCPRKRQTLLFSATMTDNVDQLIRLSLNRPVRLFVDSTKSVTENLVQEFIRVRVNPTEDELSKRESILLSLCHRTFRERAIIFCSSKAQCHRLKIVFALSKLPAAELHGSLSQLQRLEALEDFRDGKVEFLIATDLAARGLDIVGVETVINFQMPSQYDRYVHRVGRTARHLSSGRAVSLIGEKERKMMKSILLNLKPGQVVKQRVIPAKVIQKYREKLASQEEMIERIMRDEKEEYAMRQAEMTLKKAENMIAHADEIYARPAKQWFRTEKEKKQEIKKEEQKESKSFFEEEYEKEMEKLNQHKRKKPRKEKEGPTAGQKIAAKHAKKSARSEKIAYIKNKKKRT